MRPQPNLPLRLAHLATLLTLAACSTAPIATAPVPPIDPPTLQPTGLLNQTEAPSPTPPAPTVTEPGPTALPGHKNGLAGYFPLATADSGLTVREIILTGGGFVRMAVDLINQQIYYMDGSVNIYALTIQPEKASTGQAVYTADDVGQLTSALGLTFGPDGTLYVLGNISDETHTHAVVRKGVSDGQGGRTWSTVVETVPYPLGHTRFDHVYSAIAVSPDGASIYIAAGSRTDHGEVEDTQGAFPEQREMPLTSAIFRIPADSEDLVLPNDEAALKPYLFADGFRNAFDLAFGPTGDLFAIDNGPDADLPDELNWVQEDHHYGFPWRFGDVDNPMQFPNYDPLTDHSIVIEDPIYYNDPGFPPVPTTFTDPIANLGPDAVLFRDKDGQVQNSAELGQPQYSFTPHRSPLGLTIDSGNTLPGAYAGHAFLLSWGAALSDFEDRGQDLLDLNLVKNGNTYQMASTQLITGFASPIDSVLLNGKLYILDYANSGGIWEVTFPE